MKNRVLGAVLILVAAFIVWPRKSNHGLPGWGWAKEAAPGPRGDSFELARGALPGGAEDPAAALIKERARLKPVALPELRDALSATTASDPAGRFWEAAFSRPLRSARAKGGNPSDVQTRTTRPAFTSGTQAQRADAPKGKNDTQTLAATRPPAERRPSREAAAGTPSAPADRPAESARARAAEFDGARAGSGGSGRITKPSAMTVTAWEPPARKEKKAAAPPQEPKPPTLSDWMGKGNMTSPKQRVETPSFSGFKELFPPSLPGGKPYERSTPPPAAVEAVVPPGERAAYEDWLWADEKRGRKAEPHWHQDGAEPVFHAGKAWGVVTQGHWTWMQEHYRRWWTVADGAQRLVRHDDAWWWRTEDGWFLLKGGEPWAYRSFPDWKGHGFIHPTRGTQLVYSADGARLAVITPGEDTVVFDCASGAMLGRYPGGKTLAATAAGD